jgi:hypothetical protein
MIKYALYFLSLLFVYTAGAQDLSGLWVVNRVEIDDQNMTPIARWTRLNTDGTYQSGNGWTQNETGEYNMTSDGRISLKSDYGVRDTFEPFAVTVSGDEMVWTRNEEGAGVTVHFDKSDELPMAPSDYLKGLWKLKSDSDESTQEETPWYFHFRPDRIYRQLKPEGDRKTGYWHVHGHRPELTLLPHSEDEKPMGWNIKTSDKTLNMEGISDSNRGRTLRFERVHVFP